jgi:hypothetical protein
VGPVNSPCLFDCQLVGSLEGYYVDWPVSLRDETVVAVGRVPWGVTHEARMFDWEQVSEGGEGEEL